MPSCVDKCVTCLLSTASMQAGFFLGLDFVFYCWTLLSNMRWYGSDMTDGGHIGEDGDEDGCWSRKRSSGWFR